MSSSLDNYDDYSNNVFVEHQSKLMTMLPRCAALILLCCTLFTARMPWHCWHRLYHQLMLCLSLHLILFPLAHMVGTTAMPVDTLNVWGARGTTQTCSAQGFVIQLLLGVFFYYMLLLVYSYMAFRHDFEIHKFAWIEKWIHSITNGALLGSALYAQSQSIECCALHL